MGTQTFLAGQLAQYPCIGIYFLLRRAARNPRATLVIPQEPSAGIRDGASSVRPSVKRDH